MDSTSQYYYDSQDNTFPSLTIQEGAPAQTVFIKPGRMVVLGTDDGCELVLPFGKKIFPRHASLEWSSNSRILRKLFDPALIMVNDNLVKTQCEINDGDQIKMGDISFLYADPISRRKKTFAQSLEEPEAAPDTPDTSSSKKMSPTIPEHIFKQDITTIGRDRSNTIVLFHEMVSRFHARIEHKNKAYYLDDLNSANGTFLNGVPIRNSIITPKDLIQIGDFEFIFDGKSLKQASPENEARIDVINLKRTIANKIVILNNINLSISPRELVAVVGGSGAGKSTLMNAMGGFSPADSGHVLINGRDFYKYFNAFRSTLGYVPQDDIIHRELSVYRALYYSACLRMSSDIGKKERELRIQKVLEDLQLLHRKNTPIKQLSGGERKRVSIGVELLTRPRLFYLDEPTSGLDPGLESEMMRIFRRLADQGHTTILITHATKNIEICDRVVFLARGGYVAYFGPPKEALEYFDVDDFSDIYIKLEKAQKPEEWGNQFNNSPEYQKYVAERLAEVEVEKGIEKAKTSKGQQKPKKGVRRGHTSQIRQFFLLTRRYFEIIFKDKKNLAILLLQAPVIATLLAVVYKPDIFSETDGNYGSAKSLLFFIICICIWFGTSNAAREIAKEIAIYRRERFINLGVAPYVLSKVAVLSILSFIQTAVLFLIIFSKVIIPGGDLLIYGDMFLVLLLTSICSMAMGLMVSAIVSNPDKAASIVPILLIPQIVFSGGVLPLEGTAEKISYLTLSRWGFELLGKITDVTRAPLFTIPVLKRTTDTNFDIIVGNHWIILLAYTLVFILIACLFQRLKDYSRVR